VRNTSGLWRGNPGRRPESLATKTRDWRADLQEIVGQVFRDRAFRKRLVARLKRLDDPKLLQLVLSYAHGRPGAIREGAAEDQYWRLARLVAGTGGDDDVAPGKVA
jgi:hypothetical protein